MSPAGGPSPAAKAAAAAAKMPATQRQRRYEQLMGDKEPDVTDKKFVHELQTRLEIKYYESQLSKEKQLAESEKRRIRKLVMEGVLEAEDRRQARGDEEQREAEWKEFWPQNPNKTLEEYEEEKRRAEEKHQKEEAAAEEGRRQEALAAEGGGGEDEGQTGTAAGSGGGGTDRAEASGGGGGGGTTGRSAQQMPAGKYTRAQSARIKALEEEEDLDQLYQKATELVYIMAPVPRAARAKANK